VRLAITILALSAFAYASDWQTGKVAVHPTIVKDMFADYPGHLYRESQAGYTCMDGDADNAPVCISDEHSTVVVTSGYATVTLADGLQFEVPDYTQAGLIYDPHFIIQDDMYCMDNVYRPKGVGYITSGYQCTIFKRLVLKLTFPGGLGFTFQGKPTEQKTFTFQYRLAKSRKGGEQEIDIKGVGKGVYISPRLSSSSTPVAPAAPDTAAARKQFVKTVFESVKERAPGFNITTDGPDANTYVLHFPGMNYAECQGVFTTEVVSELKTAGFTQYVCTDDGNTRFAFNLTSKASEAAASLEKPKEKAIPHEVAPAPKSPVTSPDANGAVTPDLPRENGVLLFASRTHAHVRNSKLEEFSGIVDDLISFLKSNGVPVVNDLIHRSVLSEETTSTDTLVTYLRQIGAQRLLLLTVDRPFTANLKLILRCYDPDGKVLWEETVKDNAFRERTAVSQATLELHKRLGLRMQELRANDPPNSTALTVAPPAAVAPEAAARKQFAQTVREKTVQQLGSQLSPGFNITADGPDATIYVYHVGALTYSDCNSMFINRGMVSSLQKAGFTQFVCTDDGNTRFAFDITANKNQGPAPSPSNQGQLIPNSESARAQTSPLSCPPLGHCLAILRSGFSILHEHRLVMGTTTRLYLSVDDSTFTDVPTEEITGYEKERTPEATASAEKRTQAQSQPVAKPTPGPANTPNPITQQQSQPNSSASGALIVKPDRPQPFGFHVRMTEREAIAAVGRAAVKAGYPKPMPYGSVLLLTTAPKPNSSFEDYALKFSTEGLFEVWTHTPGIHSADNGTQVRDEFNDLRKLIAGKYGEPKCFDFRDAGTSDRPDFFMLYLKDKEQHLSCTWSVGTRSAAILLEAESLDIDTAIVGVKYQFYPEFEKAQVGADDKKTDSF